MTSGMWRAIGPCVRRLNRCECYGVYVQDKFTMDYELLLRVCLSRKHVEREK